MLKLLGTGFFMDPTKITIDLNNKKAAILNTDKPIYLYKAKGVYVATSFYINKIKIKDNVGLSKKSTQDKVSTANLIFFAE